MADNKDIEQKIKLEYETNADQVAKQVDTLADAQDDVTEAQTKNTKSSKAQSEALGQLSPALKGTVDGLKATGKAMWALVANPIVATIALIVGGLALLFKAFSSTNEGADKVDQIMSGLSATIDVLRDRILKIGSAIVKFMSGDFKGAMAEGYEAVAGFGDEVAAEFKKAADATKSLQEVEDATRSLGVARAKLNRDLAQSKEIITDETASYADKKKAIDEVKKAEALQTEQELANAQKKLVAIKELNALSDTSDEDLQKEADAESALYELQQRSAENRRQIRKTEIRADNEELARLKVINDARKALNKERYDREKKLLEDIQNLQDKSDEQKLARQKARDLNEISLLEQKGIDTREMLRLNTEKYNILEDDLKQKRADQLKAEDDERDAELREADEKRRQEKYDRDVEEGELALAQAKAFADRQNELAKLEIQRKADNQASLNALGNASLSAGKSLFEKDKKLQKGIIVAESAVALGKLGTGVVEQVSKDNTASPLTFGMPWSGVHIATGVLGAASIISNTQKALSALGGGSAGSAPKMPSSGGGGATSATPQVDFQASSENQIGNTVASNLNEAAPLQVYVTESDISSKQNSVKTLVTSNSI